MCDSRRPRAQIELLTSGTTGPPKRFALTYDMIAKHVIGRNVLSASSAPEAAKLPPILLFYPFGNFSGLYATLPPILSGMRGVLVDRLTLEGWPDYVRRYRPEIGNAPTSALKTILEHNICSG